MKHPFRIAFGFLLSMPFLMSLGCPGFQRSPCKYEDAPVKAYISAYEAVEDSIVQVWFKAVEDQKSWVWSVDDHNKTDVDLHVMQFDEYNFTVDLETIDDTSILYVVEGSFITQGTCGPKTISAVKRIN